MQNTMHDGHRDIESREGVLRRYGQLILPYHVAIYTRCILSTLDRPPGPRV
jgi:hypothetical protein